MAALRTHSLAAGGTKAREPGTTSRRRAAAPSCSSPSSGVREPAEQRAMLNAEIERGLFDNERRQACVCGCVLIRRTEGISRTGPSGALRGTQRRSKAVCPVHWRPIEGPKTAVAFHLSAFAAEDSSASSVQRRGMRQASDLMV